MSIIHLISPGQTKHMKSGILMGRGGWTLSDAGYIQAQLTAEYLKNALGEGECFHIVSSPDRRCLEMAALLSDLTDSVVKIANEFLGMDFGDWEEQNEIEVRTGDGTRFEQWLENENFPSPGGESLGDVSRRSWPEFVSIVQLLESNEHLAVFVPPEIIGIFTCSLLDAPLSGIHKMSLSPAGMVVLKRDRYDRYQLFSWNARVGEASSSEATQTEVCEFEPASVR